MLAADTDIALGFLLAAVGGFFWGSYPVPIKAPSVLRAKVHPLIFQCYKSFWVFLFGWLCILINILRSKPAYVFSYWPVLGAAAWIPAGLAMIASVPRLGVGMASVLNTGASATLQFLAGQWVGESMKTYGPPGREYSLAPWYLAAVVLGMAGLVLSPVLACPQRSKGVEKKLPGLDGTRDGGESGERLCDEEPRPSSASTPTTDLISGIFLALMAGCFAALQMAVITIGKDVEKPECDDCTAYVKFVNEFDSFGSYMVSFGIGTGAVTTLLLGLFAGAEKCRGGELPQSHFGTLKVLGSLAGLCWVCGNVCATAAVSIGGSSVMGPANQAMQLITAGAWGLLYYHEVRDPKRILCWVLSAAWTVAFVILLGQEKQRQ